MSVQLENGYTRVANELLEQVVLYKLNASQLKIVLTIIRYTYGFNRKSHSLSLNFIAKATGISKRYVSSELTKLIDGNVVLVTQEHTDTQSRELQLNKDYKSWEGNTEVHQVNNPSTGEEQNTTTVEQSFTTTVEQSFHQERHIKDIYKDIYNYYISLGLVKHRKYTKDMTKAIKKAINDNKYDVEYCKTLLDRHKQVVEKTKGTKYPVRVRGITEFFGQKAYQATHLICSEYEEGGKYYERYINEENEDRHGGPLGVKPYSGDLGERMEVWTL